MNTNEKSAFSYKESYEESTLNEFKNIYDSMSNELKQDLENESKENTGVASKAHLLAPETFKSCSILSKQKDSKFLKFFSEAESKIEKEDSDSEEINRLLNEISIKEKPNELENNFKSENLNKNNTELVGITEVTNCNQPIFYSATEIPYKFPQINNEFNGMAANVQLLAQNTGNFSFKNNQTNPYYNQYTPHTFNLQQNNIGRGSLNTFNKTQMPFSNYAHYSSDCRANQIHINNNVNNINNVNSKKVNFHYSNNLNSISNPGSFYTSSSSMARQNPYSYSNFNSSYYPNNNYNNIQNFYNMHLSLQNNLIGNFSNNPFQNNNLNIGGGSNMNQQTNPYPQTQVINNNLNKQNIEIKSSSLLRNNKKKIIEKNVTKTKKEFLSLDDIQGEEMVIFKKYKNEVTQKKQDTQPINYNISIEKTINSKNLTELFKLKEYNESLKENIVKIGKGNNHLIFPKIKNDFVELMNHKFANYVILEMIPFLSKKNLNLIFHDIVSHFFTFYY